MTVSFLIATSNLALEDCSEAPTKPAWMADWGLDNGFIIMFPPRAHGKNFTGAPEFFLVRIDFWTDLPFSIYSQ